MDNCKPITTPVADDEGSNVIPTLFKIFVGSLMYLTTTKPGIMQGVSLISKFMETPKYTHWTIGKITMTYIAGT